MSEVDPKWVQEAKKQIGIAEIDGSEHNPEILAMGRDAGIDWYREDEVPWCAVAANAWVRRAGYAGTDSAMAKSFSRSANFERLSEPRYGSIIVLHRGDPNGPSGHVGFYMGKNQRGNVLILGGNQGDAVNIKAYDVNRVVGYYWPVGASKPWLDERTFLQKNTNRVGVPGATAAAVMSVDGIEDVTTIMTSPAAQTIEAIWPAARVVIAVVALGAMIYFIVRKHMKDKDE